jgi:hypothetical protein
VRFDLASVELDPARIEDVHLDHAGKLPAAMSFLSKVLLGNGTLKPKLKAALESEGLVLVEEGLSGWIRYEQFKMPGRRFNGKVTGERVGIGISEKRVVVYCKSGRVKLVNSAYSNPDLDIVDVSLDGDDKIVFRIDYDRSDQEKVSGVIKISAKTPNAATIVGELRTRLGR